MQRLVRTLATLACAFALQNADSLAQTAKTTPTKKADAGKPVFSYLAGPNNCTQPAGYPDAALCTVPDEKPPGTFKGPNTGQSYVDPNFGGKVRVLAPPTSYHGYSAPNAMSATNRYTLISQNDVPTIVETATGKRVVEPGTPFEGAMWDARDDNFLYYLSGPTIQRYDLSVRRTTTIMDYSKAPFGFSAIQTGSQSDTSKDNWIGFVALAQKQVCAVDLNGANTYCGSWASTVVGRDLGSVQQGSIFMSKGVDTGSNKRYVIIGASPMAFYSVNTGTGKLDFEFLGPEVLTYSPPKGNLDGVCNPGERCLFGDHIDTFEDANGVQFLVTPLESTTPCEFTFDTYRINAGTKMTTLVENGGGRTRVFPMFLCSDPSPNWTDYHVGCAKRAPYCVLSTTYTGFTQQFDAAHPPRRTPHVSEIIVMKGNGDELRRLVQHRSVPIAGEAGQSYWTTPRACISNDGSLVVADSNFGESNKQRVLVIETGYGKTKIADSGVVNAACLQAKVSPGAYGTIFGLNLANCRVATSAPFPTSSCNTSVTVNNIAAPLTYLSPEQINFLIPQAVAPNKPATVTVKRGTTTDDTDVFTILAASMLETSPSVFSYAQSDGVSRAIVQNSDYSLNGPPSGDGSIRELRYNEAGIIYANGLGAVDPPVADGTAAPQSPLSGTTPTKADVLINNVPQNVLFSGLAPGFSGLFQVNFILDPATPIKDQNTLQVRVRGESSPSLAVSIAAQ